jgi:hypothetical protein
LGPSDGIGDPSKAAVYSTLMDIERASEMVSQRGCIYQAVQRDATESNQDLKDYVERIEGEAIAR